MRLDIFILDDPPSRSDTSLRHSSSTLGTSSEQRSASTSLHRRPSTFPKWNSSRFDIHPPPYRARIDYGSRRRTAPEMRSVHRRIAVDVTIRHALPETRSAALRRNAVAAVTVRRSVSFLFFSLFTNFIGPTRKFATSRRNCMECSARPRRR